MANNKQKLELTWIGKNNPEYDISNIEPRILEENPKLSNCKNNPSTGNMLIHGDNLLALKALLPEYEGKIKCIYIDPPYNTGNAFAHYDDSVEHSTWLSLMKPRLELLKILLSDDGVIFVQIDDNEQAYLKVLMDEVFGRENFLNNITWKRRGGKTSPDARKLENSVDFIIMFRKSKNFNIKFLFTKFNSESYIETQFKYVDEKGRKYRISPLNAPQPRPTLQYEFMGYKPHPNGWSVKKETLQRFYDEDKLVFPKNKEGRVNRKQYLDEWEGYAVNSLWDDIGLIAASSSERMDFDRNQKPEKLIERIIELSTEENDLVLDSFLGAGTTVATAHKMNRKYIGIEMGDHAYTHCKARLDKVIDGTDQGGISKAIKWEGGGAYKFYELAPSFIIKDEFGNPIIDTFYDDTKLIKAMCKLMNFTYKPSKTEYWKHGLGQGKNYLYVTTLLLTTGMVQQVASHLAEGETLIISPKKFEPGADKIDSRITIKKIPQSVLKACHFGKKEYLLPIKESAMEEIEEETEEDNE